MVRKVSNLRPIDSVQGILLPHGVMLQVIYGYLVEIDLLKVVSLMNI